MKTKIPKNLEEAFDKAFLVEAREIVAGYRIIIDRNDKLGYIASSVELPTIFADSKSRAQCLMAVEEALIGAVATMIECGRKPPQSSLAEKRTEQVNIRLTVYEKFLLTNKVMELGFKGISDLIRNIIIKNLSNTS